MIPLIKKLNIDDEEYACYKRVDSIVYNGLLFTCCGFRNTINIWKNDICVKSIEEVLGRIHSFIIYNNLLYLCGYMVLYVYDNHLEIFQEVRLNVKEGDLLCVGVYDELLCIGTNGQSIILINTENKCEKILKGHDTNILCLIEYNGFLYSGGLDSTICVWDKEGNIIKTLKVHTDEVRCFIVFNGFLYSGGWDKTIIKWNREYNYIMMQGHTCHIRCFVIYDNILYSGSADHTIRAWNLDDKCLSVFQMHRHHLASFAIYNNLLYSFDEHSDINISGKYYTHHQKRLPQTQKEKIKNWNSSKYGIQKDLHFLFERELLL